MRGLPRQVLVLIVDEGTIEARDGRISRVIADMLDCPAHRVTPILHRLAEQGLIVRRYVPVSGRTFSVRPTPEGRAVVGREGHVSAVVRRRAEPVAAPMPVCGPIGHLDFDPDAARARALEVAS